jgi:hypothetical protein
MLTIATDVDTLLNTLTVLRHVPVLKPIHPIRPSGCTR